MRQASESVISESVISEPVCPGGSDGLLIYWPYRLLVHWLLIH